MNAPIVVKVPTDHDDHEVGTEALWSLCSRRHEPRRGDQHHGMISLGDNYHLRDNPDDLPYWWEADSAIAPDGTYCYAEGYSATYDEALACVLAVWACGPHQVDVWPCEPLPYKTFSQRMAGL
jgi:hypothetical protein